MVKGKLKLKMSSMKNISLIALLLTGLLHSCMDVIDVNLPEGNELVIIDAWVNNLNQDQVIKLRTTAPYFDDVDLPAVSGALVSITDNNDSTFLFVEDGSTGNYIWSPQGGQVFGQVNDTYVLTVQIGSNIYTAESYMGRTTPIDSITYEFEEGDGLNPDGIYAQFYATDPVGIGDAYWIKAFKNNVFLNKPQELNWAYDAGFSPGGSIDGVVFIEPLREINREPDSGEGATDNDDVSPYAIGDTIRVELHSITEEAYFFINEAWTQMTLGDNTIFAPPSSNVSNNINSDNADVEAVGFFCVSAVESLETIVDEDLL